jgi:hypothetical protein
MQAEEGLDLADDRAAGRVGCEHLPQETFQGQAQGVNPRAIEGAFVGLTEQVGR